MSVSSHAKRRMLERGLYPVHIELLQRFGKVSYHNGSQIVSLDKKSKKKLRNFVGPKLVGEIFSGNCPYLVEANGTIVTIARKNMSFKSKR